MQERGTPDPRTIRAWRLYHDAVRDLDGQEYDAAEARAWERLERMLAEIRRGPSRRRADVRV